MLGLSLPEIIFLAVLALVVIGPKQLPEVARTLGRMLNEFRRVSSTLTDEFREQVKIDPIRLEDPIPSDRQASKPHRANEGTEYEELDSGETETSSHEAETKKS